MEKPECVDQIKSSIFAQFECNYDEDQLPKRRIDAFIIISIDIFVVLIFIILVRYIK